MKQQPSRDPNAPHPGMVFDGMQWRSEESIRRRRAKGVSRQKENRALFRLLLDKYGVERLKEMSR